MSATVTLMNDTFANLPFNNDPSDQNLATDACVADATTVQPPAGRVLYHAFDGKWYTCDASLADLQIPLHEIAAADADKWYQAEARPSITEIRACFNRTFNAWLLQYGSASGTVKDKKGMRYIQELLSRPHKPIAATTLARLDLSEEPGISAKPIELDDEDHPLIGMGGSKDFILDDDAIRLYRREMKRLAEEIQEARDNHDTAAIRELQAEFQFYAEDLAKNTKKGKPKRFAAGDDSEKARSAVTQALRRAFQAIRKSDSSLQPLAEYLQSHIETGVECVYRPGSERISWDLN